MADPVFVDGMPLSPINMNKLQTRDEKGVVSGYAALDAAGYVLAPVGAKFGADTNLYRSAAGKLKTDGELQAVGNISSYLATGDAQPTVVLARNLSGPGLSGIAFGPGGATVVDTNLYRSGAGSLKTDGHLNVGGFLFAGWDQAADSGGMAMRQGGDTNYRLFMGNSGKLQWGNGTAGVDTTLYRRSASELASDGDLTLFVKGVGNGLTLQSLAGHATDYVHNHYVAGEAANRFRLRQDGQMVWGPGTGATDTNLYRSGAGTLRTDGVFFVGGQVGVDVAGTGARLTFGSGGDTYLYRMRANTLRTPGDLWVDGKLYIGGAVQAAVPANQIYRFPIYATNDTFLGWVPCYS